MPHDFRGFFSGRVHLLDLSDQIDDELSEVGGNIYQAEERSKPYREAVENERLGVAGGAGGRYGKLKWPKFLAKWEKTNRINE